MRPTVEDFVVQVTANGERFAEIVRNGPLDAPVVSCPDWTLLDLAHHLGYVHRWARLAAATAAPPDGAQIESPPSGGADDLADWMAAGVTGLTATLADLDPDAPTWHPFPFEPLAGVWPRRQAHETAVHRWDAESAVRAFTPIDPLLAADGVVEYFELIIPRLVQRDGIVLPSGRLHLRLDDADLLLTITASDHAGVGLAITTASGSSAEPADDIVVGRAEDVLLALWGRQPLPTAPESEVARRWLAVGGN